MIITPLKINSDAGEKAVQTLLDRFEPADSAMASRVAAILDDVRNRGDAAVIDYTRRYDAPELNQPLAVTSKELEQAYGLVDKPFLETLDKAIERIERFHERELEDSWVQTRDNGTIVGRLVRPVDRAGLYVPGGQGGSTPLVSSVLMNGIPAAIAGVSERIMMTPPGTDGSVNPYLLVAAQKIGISEIYRAGSAWAIGAMTYGTETISRVDVIVGPGNQYVTEAKRQVSGMVRIDMIAGPSEVLIVADEQADPVHIAADMLAQAEHDSQALAVVITTDSSKPEQIVRELERQLPELSREEIARASLADRGQILLAQSLEEAIDLANEIAVEPGWTRECQSGLCL